jgi:hypothetical protein
MPGGGPILYWNQDLRLLDAKLTRLVASVVGLSDVEVLTRAAGNWEATTLVAPDDLSGRCEPPFPVAVAVADADVDGLPDVLVFDACGGNWIALGRDDGSFDTLAWESVLPALQTVPYLATFDSPRLKGSIIFAGSQVGAELLRPVAEGSTMPAEQVAWPGPFLSLPVTTLAIGTGSTGDADEASIFVQGGAQLLELRSRNTGTTEVARTLVQEVEPPYLAAFGAFNHLTSIELSDCGLLAAGTGLFGAAAMVTVENLQIIELNDARQKVHDVDLGLDVASFAVVHRLMRNDALIAVIGARKVAQGPVISLWRVSNCTDVERLLEASVEFDWRTPNQNSNGQIVPITKSLGLKVLAGWNEDRNELVVAHYDGFDVRTFIMVEKNATWSMVAEKQGLHAKRDDLVSAP